MRHPLHKQVGDFITEYFQINNFANVKVIKDQACESNPLAKKQQIPLFCSEDKNWKTAFCKVDMVILRDDKVYMLIEIEESSIDPVRLFGKFFASALSSCYIHENDGNSPIPMNLRAWFIQIVNTSKTVKDLSSKPDQCNNIKESIRRTIPIGNSNIEHYDLLLGELSDFDRTIRPQLETCLQKAFR